MGDPKTKALLRQLLLLSPLSNVGLEGVGYLAPCLSRQLKSFHLFFSADRIPFAPILRAQGPLWGTAFLAQLHLRVTSSAPSFVETDELMWPFLLLAVFPQPEEALPQNLSLLGRAHSLE